MCLSTYRESFQKVCLKAGVWGRGERYRPAPLTQDINMAVLNIADALFDGLVTAHVQWKQRQGLAICISCRLH